MKDDRIYGQDAGGKKKRKKKGSLLSVLLTILLFISLGVMLYAGYRLYDILHNYRGAEKEYDALAEEFTVPNAQYVEAVETVSQPEGSAFESTAEPPITVDWEELKAVNEDVVGWLYIEACPNINYPICQGEDNDYYLHHTFRHEEFYPASIFMDCSSASDFSDHGTLVYGHRMSDGSMFGTLKELKKQEVIDESPYFWILTPEGNYRYEIFAAFDASITSDVFSLFSMGGPEFLAWEQAAKDKSEIENDVPLFEDDYTVVMSTCTDDATVRCVVYGKCISAVRPRNPLDALLENTGEESGQQEES